jgi:Ca2+-binding EF-hand superfamily protein
MWSKISGDDDKVTKEEFESGLTVVLPPVFGEYVPKLAECLMKAYDVSGDGVIDETEFKDGYGKHLPGCLEEHVPKELLAKMANHNNCGDEADTLETVFHAMSGGDDEMIPADLAAAIGKQVPQFAKHAMPLAECVVELVDGNKDGAVQFEEFKAAMEKDMDILTPCFEKLPREELANAAAHNDEHWCHSTDPEKEPCCQKTSHDEQDACMKDKMDDSHHCDFTGPEDEPCCAKTSREDQDACLEAKTGLLLGQKKRKPHLPSKEVQAAFARFLRGRTVQVNKL